MAVDAPFPSLGDDPWGGTIIPWAEQVRENINELAQTVNEGRLSPGELSATIDEVVARRAPSPSEAFTLRTADRTASPIDVVVRGSSTVEGVGASSRERKFANLLARAMQATYNPIGAPGGLCFPAIDSGWTTSGTQTFVAEGISGRAYSLSAGATLSRTFDLSTGFTVQAKSGSQYTVTIDEHPPVQVAATGTGFHNWVSPTLERGTHTVAITANNTTVVSAVYAHDNDMNVGMRVWAGGKGGTQISDWIGSGGMAESGRAAFAAIAPKVVMLVTGSNEAAAEVTPATFQGQVETWMTEQQTALGYEPLFVIVGMFSRADATYPWGDYLAAMEAAAETRSNAVYIDASGPFPTTQAEDTWDLVGADNVHLTQRGHARFADEIARLLGIPTRAATTVAPSVLGTFPAPDDPPISGYDFRADSSLLTYVTANTLTLPDGAGVETLIPTGGTHRDPLTQVTPAKRPLLLADDPAINGRNSLDFTKANAQALASGTWPAPAPYSPPMTTIIVLRVDDLGVVTTYYSGQSSRYTYIGTSSTGGGTWVFGAGGTVQYTKFGAKVGWHVLTVVWDGASSRFYIDALTPTTGTTGGTAAGHDRLKIGENSGGNMWADMGFAMAALVGRALTQSEVEATMTALGDWHGITIAA